MVLPDFIRPALVILVTAAIVFIVIAISRNGTNYSAPVQSTFQQLPPNIDIALKKARFSDMKGGAVDWVLVADTVEYDKSGDIAHLTGGIVMDFVKSNAHGAVKVTADSGEYQSNSKNIKLRGNVHVLTDDGASFDVDSIDYTATISQFKTADRVVCRQERLLLNATGMVMDLKDQRANFMSAVDATVAGGGIHGAVPESVTAPAMKSVGKVPVKSAVKKVKSVTKKRIVKKNVKRRRSKK